MEAPGHCAGVGVQVVPLLVGFIRWYGGELDAGDPR